MAVQKTMEEYKLIQKDHCRRLGYRCRFCEATRCFETNNDLLNHESTQHNHPYQCPLCNIRSFSHWNELLNDHLSHDQIHPDTKNWECKFPGCNGKKLDSKTEYVIHVYLDHPDRMYRCRHKRCIDGNGRRLTFLSLRQFFEHYDDDHANTRNGALSDHDAEEVQDEDEDEDEDGVDSEMDSTDIDE